MSSVLFFVSSIVVAFGRRGPEHRPLTLWGHDRFDKQALLGDNPQFIHDPKYEEAGYPVQLSLSPEILTTPNGIQLITMSWSNATTAKSSDWIGIYSPIDAADDEWLDWFYTDGTANGRYQDHVWNLRDDYELRYFLNNGNGKYVLLGTSNTAKVEPKQPLQGHISLTENSPYEMQIRWVSSLVTNPQVQIGINSNQYTKTYNATYYTYDTTNMCGSSASIISPTRFRDPGYFYTVIADNLQPNTRYYYKFGCIGYWSDEQTFLTGSVPGDGKDNPFEFIMYGDVGPYTNSFATMLNIENEMEKENNNIGLLLHIGDISYAEGYNYIWDEFCNMISNVASKIPYMISVGNHEYCHTSPVNNKHSNGLDVSGVGGTGYHPSWGNCGDDSGGECGAPTYYRFDAPLGSASNSIFWYSFNYNMVHFVMLSSEHDYSAGSVASKWLQNDLKQAYNMKNEKKISWIIITIHRSLYESEIYPGDNEESVHLIEILEPTMYEYGVDLMLNGHYHSYERTCAVLNYTCIGQKNNGITHMTIGTGGIDLDNALYQDVDWSVFRDERDYGFGKFTVNTTTLIGQFVTNEAGVVDQIILNK